MEQASSAFSTGVPALAAIPQLAGNSRQGFGLVDGTMRWASGWVISSNTLGLSTSLYDGDAGSRSTGKERDTESANDYFEARYFGSSMGRFLSPDPLGGKLANPQSLNKYAYALNNPLVNTDPTGMYVCADSNDCSSDNDKKFAQSLADARNAAWNLSGADLLNAMNAINSYGDAGKDNGVTVGFNSNLTDSNGNPEAGETQVSGVANGTKSALNPDGQNIHVAFRPDQLTGAVGAGLVAHEGSHASDGAAWVASGFSAAKDPTHMETEFNAYHVEFNIANTILREGWSGSGFPPSYTKSGHNGSASWFATDSWDPVNSDQIKGFINANYSNLNSPAFTKGAVVPR